MTISEWSLLMRSGMIPGLMGRTYLYLFIGVFSFSAAADWCQDLPSARYEGPVVEGLLQVGDAADHERASAARFAKFLVDQRLVLGLASFIGGMDVPAFDAVALDEERNPIANVSIKSIGRANADEIIRMARKSFSKMVEFSTCKNWREFYSHATRSATAQGASKVETRLRQILTIYRPDEPRAHWVLFDQEHSRPLADEDLDRIARELTDDQPGRRVLILNAGGVVAMWEGEWKRFGGCALSVSKPARR